MADNLTALGTPEKACERCGDPIPARNRARRRYCGAYCRNKVYGDAYRARKASERPQL